MRPRRRSGNASRSAKPRARSVSILRGYSVQGPVFPQSFARLASATENVDTTGSCPTRFAVHVATIASPSPSTRSTMNSHTGEPMQRALAASPHRDGRPLITAIDCSDCIGDRPTSAPCWMARTQSAGRPRKSFGANCESASSRRSWRPGSSRASAPSAGSRKARSRSSSSSLLRVLVVVLVVVVPVA